MAVVFQVVSRRVCWAGELYIRGDRMSSSLVRKRNRERRDAAMMQRVQLLLNERDCGSYYRIFVRSLVKSTIFGGFGVCVCTSQKIHQRISMQMLRKSACGDCGAVALCVCVEREWVNLRRERGGGAVEMLGEGYLWPAPVCEVCGSSGCPAGWRGTPAEAGRRWAAKGRPLRYSGQFKTEYGYTVRAREPQAGLGIGAIEPHT
ncbi:hypothetical protein DFH27DRAFT_267052 [Peziza echinospora]|nr:hypothetical protein DFH27DRAFT_267052 [Peziza echinospora]